MASARRSTGSGDHQQTPLHGAANAEVAQCLLEAGAAPTAPDKNGWNPLHAACADLRDDVVRVLVASSSELNIPDRDGYYPMHLVLFRVREAGCSHTALETLSVLVENGSSWDSTCDRIADQVAVWPTSMGTKPIGSRDEAWRKEAPALRQCVDRWTKEHRRDLPLTAVPVEVIHRGEDATKIYLEALASSTNLAIRSKICIVGPSGCGKTSLIKSLTTGKPSLVAQDDRTFGVDQFLFAFEETFVGHNIKKKHEVTFWDFSGQDAFQVAYSLFYSARSLYVVCVDVEEYVLARMLAASESQPDSSMNKFVETNILRWIRPICACQLDARFVFVATKSDRVDQVDLEAVMDDLRKDLENVVVIIQEMKDAVIKKERDAQPTGGLEKTQDDDAAAALPIMHLGDPRLASMVKKPSVRILVANCVTSASIDAFKMEIEDVIKESNRGYPMPHKYSLVRKVLLTMRADAVEATTIFCHVDKLVADLVSSQPDEYLDEITCRAILRTLHDLGDVLWYDTIDDDLLKSTIVLDPTFMVDLVWELVNHSHTEKVMTHATLKGLKHWRSLEGTDSMLYMKLLLQRFQLVCPTSGEMTADSDLILSASYDSTSTS